MENEKITIRTNIFIDKYEEVEKAQLFRAINILTRLGIVDDWYHCGFRDNYLAIVFKKSSIKNISLEHDSIILFGEEGE